MANKIIYGSYVWEGDLIADADITQTQSLISRELVADAFTAIVQSDQVGDKALYTVLNELYATLGAEEYVVPGNDIRNFVYGTPVEFWHDGKLYGKFYLTQIDRLSETYFKLSCTSAVGLLTRQYHMGDVYAGVRAGLIIDSIMAGTNINYTVSPAVANTVVSGYLPHALKRDNLKQLLFAIGANITKSASGNLQFEFNTTSTTQNIEDERIAEGGSIPITSPVTSIVLSEHTYYRNPSSELEVVYTHSGTPADYKTINMDEPIVASSIDADSGITINQAGANYITFSGIGSIRAVKYTHVSTELTWNNTESASEQKNESFNDATLVTALNSANVLKRLQRFFVEAKEINCEIKLNDEKAGDNITFTDPHGEDTSGFIASLDINASGTLLGEAKIITNWYPTDSGNNFNAYQLIQNTGTVTVPAAARGKPGRLVLIGGFCGGQGGTAGESGTGSQIAPHEKGAQSDPVTPGKGGTHGGKGGAGGVGVMVRTINIDALPSSFTVNSIGAGGAGGAAGAYGGSGSMGSLGGNTIVTVAGVSYSTADGALDTTGFINVIDGTFYNVPGDSGFDNDNGYGGDGSSYSVGNKGGSVTYGNVTWKGGTYGKSDGAGSSYYLGGGGGGAAYGSNGPDGFDAGRRGPGTGGYGATAATPPQASFPRCGTGGSGGGCGGGAGGGSCYYGSAYYEGAGGPGGAGAPGGQGSNGAVIFYYGG